MITRRPKKKESKWKQKRNKALYPKKRNNKILVFVMVLFLIGTAATFTYAKNYFKFEKPVQNMTQDLNQNRNEYFKVVKQKPLSPIHFNRLEVD